MFTLWSDFSLFFFFKFMTMLIFNSWKDFAVFMWISLLLHVGHYYVYKKPAKMTYFDNFNKAISKYIKIASQKEQASVGFILVYLIKFVQNDLLKPVCWTSESFRLVVGLSSVAYHQRKKKKNIIHYHFIDAISASTESSIILI